MYVCFVKHDGDPKKYLFDCTNVYRKLAVGKKVVCETIRGLETGTVISYPTEIKEGIGTRELIEATGAYMPLKRVLRVFGDIDMLEEERREIVKQYIRDHARFEQLALQTLREELGFDQEQIEKFVEAFSERAAEEAMRIEARMRKH